VKPSQNVLSSPAQDRPAANAVGRGSTFLALDLGSLTGWALRGPDGAITSGVQQFRPNRFEGGGMAFLRFNHWLSEIAESSGPITAVSFEEVRAHTGTLAAQIFGGFLAHLASWAEFRDIPYQGVPVGTIKRFIAGKGNADKAAVIAAVKAKGFAPADDNEADALAILLWSIENFGGVS
jgi:crossover junction endodeoxyribonuclease RuvC